MARRSDKQAETPSAEQRKASITDAIGKLTGDPRIETDDRTQQRERGESVPAQRRDQARRQP